MGKTLGDGIASGVEGAKAKVEQAADKVSAALKKVEDQTGKTKVAEAQLQALRDKGVTDAGKLAAAEEKVEAARRNEKVATDNYAKSVDALKTSQDKLAAAEKAAGDAAQKGSEKGKNAFKDLADTAGKHLDGLSSKMGDFAKKAATGLGFGAGFGLAALTKSLLDVGEDSAKVNKTIVSATGASGEALEKFNKSIENIALSSPKTKDAIAETMAGIAQATQIEAGPVLETLTKQSMKLSSMGRDVDIQGFTQAMRQAGVPTEEYSKQLDAVYKAAVATGAPMSSLVESLSSGGGQLKAFGLNTEQSLALLGQFNKAGINGGDAMATLRHALKDVGNEDGLNKVIKQIKQLSDAGNSDGAQKLAEKTFGSKGFATILPAIKEGKIDLDALNKSLGDNTKGILDSAAAPTTLSGVWQVFRNNIDKFIEGPGQKVFAIMQDGIKWFRDKGVGYIREFGDWLKGIWNSEAVQNFVSKVVGLFNDWWPKIVDTVKDVGSAIMDIGQVAGPILLGALGAIGSAFGAVTGFIGDNKTAFEVLSGVVLTVLIPPLGAAAIAATTSAAAQVAAWVSTKVEAVTSAAAQVAASWSTVGGWASAAISATVSAATVVAGWVASATAATVNAAKIAAGWVVAGAGAAGAAAKTVAYTIAQNAVKVATAAWTGAQWLLNAALDANPIGIVVTAIAALAAGIIYAYNHSETFRKIVQAAWAGIKLAVEVVVHWFTDVVWPALKKVWEAIGDGWHWLVTKAEEVWTGVKEKFTAMVDFVTSLPDKIANVGKNLWEGLKGGLVGVLNWIGDKWNSFADTLSVDIPGVGKVSLPKIPHIDGFSGGGYTGDLPTKQIAGVVHGGEQVIKAASTKMLNNAYPGLLDYLNGHGKLPGFEDGGLVPYGLPPGTNTGGYGSSGAVFPAWVHALEQQFGLKASTYPGHQETDRKEPGYSPNPQHLNRGIDWVGDVASMQKFAAFMAGQKFAEQVIFQNPATGQNTEAVAGQARPGYFAGDLPAHRNHVHTRQAFAIGAAALSSVKPAKAEAKSESASGTSTPAAAESTTGASGGGSSVKVPSSITGLSTSWVDSVSAGHTSSPGHRDPLAPDYFPKAITAAVGGQVSSLLSVAGIPDSPSWLGALGQAAAQISIKPKGVGDIGADKHQGTGAAPGPMLYDSAGWLPQGVNLVENRTGGPEPVLTTNQWNVAQDGVKVAMAVAKGIGRGGGSASAKAAPQVNYTINARDTEDAFVRARQRERERAAAKLDRF